MNELEDELSWLKIRIPMYLKTIELKGKYFAIVESVPEEHFLDQVTLLLYRKVGEGELDIFCGYYKDREETKAIFLSLCPDEPIMLFTRDEVKERIKNFKGRKLPVEQSEEALSGWPN